MGFGRLRKWRYFGMATERSLTMKRAIGVLAAVMAFAPTAAFADQQQAQKEWIPLRINGTIVLFLCRA